MSVPGEPKTVIALFKFKGSNNDELCFNKGDIITVTQQIEGGWWEGTLNGMTGWYPSNYVKEYKLDSRAGARSPTGKPTDLPLNKRESMLHYHNLVLKSLTDSERIFVNELQSLLQSYLRPLQEAKTLNPVEYSQLVGNLEDVVNLHQSFLTTLDEYAKLPVNQQRVGGAALKVAPQFKLCYSRYCSNHPKAASILQKRMEELCKFMESNGAPAPGIKLLTTHLSKPFTRLGKYSNVLKELERHTVESHVDRGDTQRAIIVFKEINHTCIEIRKQKEIEFDIMNSSIKGWEGQDISHLGETILLSHVNVESDNGEKKEHLFLLFPSILVMLSVSPRNSGYSYEGKIPVSGMTVNALEDTEKLTNAFEMMSNLIDRRIVSCVTSFEQRHWVEALSQQAKLSPSQSTSKPLSLQISNSQPSMSTLSHAKTILVMHQPPSKAKKGTWTMSCLRPSPPVKPSTLGRDDGTKSPKLQRKGTLRRKAERAHSQDDYLNYKKIDDCRILEDDALVLRVIEAYCTSAKTRHTVNSSILDTPSVILVDEEKIIVEEIKGNETVMEEKSLVDTVYSLQGQVKDLRQDHKKMKQDIDEEKQARKKLENMVRKSLKIVLEVNKDANMNDDKKELAIVSSNSDSNMITTTTNAVMSISETTTTASVT